MSPQWLFRPFHRLHPIHIIASLHCDSVSHQRQRCLRHVNILDAFRLASLSFSLTVTFRPRLPLSCSRTSTFGSYTLHCDCSMGSPFIVATQPRGRNIPFMCWTRRFRSFLRPHTHCCLSLSSQTAPSKPHTCIANLSIRSRLHVSLSPPRLWLAVDRPFRQTSSAKSTHSVLQLSAKQLMLNNSR